LPQKDINTIIEKTGCSRQEAENALKEKGDLAEAILSLSE
jgi:NACalpha-BTF3-like transcription factor